MRLTGKGAPKSQKNVAPAWLWAVLNTPDEEVAGSPSIRSREPEIWLKKPSLDHARGWPPRVKSRGLAVEKALARSAEQFDEVFPGLEL